MFATQATEVMKLQQRIDYLEQRLEQRENLITDLADRLATAEQARKAQTNPQ